jgi:hypothetical protein
MCNGNNVMLPSGIVSQYVVLETPITSLELQTEECQWLFTSDCASQDNN